MTSYRDQFEKDGFIITRNVLKPQTVEKANIAFEAFLTKNRFMLQKQGLLVTGLLQRVVNLHHSSERCFHRIISNRPHA